MLEQMRHCLLHFHFDLKQKLDYEHFAIVRVVVVQLVIAVVLVLLVVYLAQLFAFLEDF